VPLVLDALGGRKADLVVCDGAPDGEPGHTHSEAMLIRSDRGTRSGRIFALAATTGCTSRTRPSD